MTNFEYLKQASLEDVARFLCSVVDHENVPGNNCCCDFCIAKEYCYHGHKGFLDWLMKEYK